MQVVARGVTVSTRRAMEFLDVTDRLAGTVADSGVERGLMHVSSLHTTAALMVGELQEALLHDMHGLLCRLVDDGVCYRHNQPEFSDCDRRNAAAHLRGMLLSASVSLPIVDARAVLGPYQRILLAELDGPRERRLHVQILGSV